MLSPGQKLGPYEILASLGEGGMGQVWKARDTRLGRIVAIKTAKQSFTERFEREARAVASLNHPNICTLFDVGPDYLVMEYIEGRPLKGPLPVALALRYAVEIARALDAAHRIGIIHRDLKPGNILATKSGIKLLDFGLAKVTAATHSSDETLTQALTGEGTILGTLQYMSPEQLQGKEADARSDIFAFGCVLQEMLTGTRAFPGESRAGIIAAIMEHAPQPLPGVPERLRNAIHRCMAKDPEDRWQSARDVAGVLELSAEGLDAGAPVVRNSKRALTAMAAIAILASAAALWFAMRRPEEQIWSGQALGGAPLSVGPRVSPDGQTIAFHAIVGGQSQVAIMKPETGNWTVLTHQTEFGPIGSIDWAADGSKLYFDRSTDTPRGIFSVPLLGGEPRMVLEDAGAPCVLADGSLVVARINPHRDLQMFHYWPESAKIESLPASPDSTIMPVIRSLPGGKAILFFGSSLDAGGKRGPRGIFTLETDSGKLTNIAPRQIFSKGPVAVAPTRDGQSIVFSITQGGMTSVMSAPRSGSGEMRQLFTLTNNSWFLDVAPDGSVYADQHLVGRSLLRFSPAGGVAESTVSMPSSDGQLVLVLPDGRPLIHAVAGFKRRFQIVQPDGTLAPLIESSEQCGRPAALLGNRHVAVMTDRMPLEIAIISIGDGRITRRVPVKAKSVSSLAASPNGETLYYSSAGVIWSMPASGGEPRQLGAGDSVSAGANGRDLIVSLQDKDAIRLVRMPATGGAGEPIAFRGTSRIPGTMLAASVVGPGGLLVVQTTSADAWPFQIGLIDPRAGTIARVPLNFEGELSSPNWTRDGKIVAVGETLNFSIWRFHPLK